MHHGQWQVRRESFVARNERGWGTLLGILLWLCPKETHNTFGIWSIPDSPGHFSGILVSLLIQDFFPNLEIPSLFLPFSVCLCSVYLRLSLSAGISNKWIHHYFKSVRCKGKTGFGVRMWGKFLLFADSDSGVFRFFLVCSSSSLAWPHFSPPLSSSK